MSYLWPILIILFICYLIAWAMTMMLASRAAEAKGYDDIEARLWFIGLFALPFTPCLIVAALPDRSEQNNESDLPAI